MANLKHVGKVKANGRKVLVAYRTLPGESDAALIVDTASLTEDQHDSIIKLVESPAGQSSYEFAEAMARTNFPDGSVMLANLHFNGKLIKVKTSEIEMTPSMQATISLDQLNQLIAEQRGISVNDLAIGSGQEIQEVAKVTDVPRTPDVVEEVIQTNEQPLDDEALAKKYRSDADRLSKEAAQLRRMAEELVPTKKKATTEA
jgi:hypothetical protein